MLKTVNNTNALIVGASQGIGLGFVRTLLLNKQVAKIYATYRNKESASKLITLSQEHQERLTCLSLDITAESQIEGAIKQIKADVSKLHLVV
ncbi:MAG: SDR family NAD(P)-dependent oxidoreductase, partial [Waterburya sp.]